MHFLFYLIMYKNMSTFEKHEILENNTKELLAELSSNLDIPPYAYYFIKENTEPLKTIFENNLA